MTTEAYVAGIAVAFAVVVVVAAALLLLRAVVEPLADCRGVFNGVAREAILPVEKEAVVAGVGAGGVERAAAAVTTISAVPVYSAPQREQKHTCTPHTSQLTCRPPVP